MLVAFQSQKGFPNVLTIGLEAPYGFDIVTVRED
jgi:hypothetical protein